MVQVVYNKNKVREIMDVMVAKTMSMELKWGWPCGVAYYGVAKVYEVTKQEEYLTALRTRMDELITVGFPGYNVNACAMGHVLISLYKATGEERYWSLALSKLSFLRTKALRFGEGILQHTVSSFNNDFPEQAWADTLFMAVFFMLRMGVILSDDDIINEALDQYCWHIKYLQDEDRGLWYHGYDHIKKDHMSGIFWGRANAWAVYTISQISKILPMAHLYPQYADIQCALSNHICALIEVQTQNGLWRTVLDVPSSYEELSASAGIASALVINGDPLHKSYIQKAHVGIMENIADDGTLKNVSEGTAVMPDLNGYQSVPRERPQGWGQGLALAYLADIWKS